MQALLLEGFGDPRENPLTIAEVPDPIPGPGELLIQVRTCGVCHTELDEIEGRLPPPRLPLILGHQIIGKVIGRGPGAKRFGLAERVGVGWINHACGACPRCREGRENLCRDFRATGLDAPGGYAQLALVREDFAHEIPPVFTDAEAAPLLCAGAIGYRSLHLSNLTDGENLGLTGFGASAHLIAKLVRSLYPGVRLFIFARGEKERAFARELGAFWTGDIDEPPPEELTRIIDTTPAWYPVVCALKNLAPGGRLVINAIRKEAGDISRLLLRNFTASTALPAYMILKEQVSHVNNRDAAHRGRRIEMDYASLLWREKEIKSVANVTRKDIGEFLALAARCNLKPEVETFTWKEANLALRDLKERRIRGAKVLVFD